MSGNIKHGDTIKLEVPNGASLTAVVNVYDGDLGIWFAGSWFPLSRWGGKGVTLIRPAEPERPEWADALVVRNGDGQLLHRLPGEIYWSPLDHQPQVSEMLEDHHLFDLTVIIDADGANVEAEDLRARLGFAVGLDNSQQETIADLRARLADRGDASKALGSFSDRLNKAHAEGERAGATRVAEWADDFRDRILPSPGYWDGFREALQRTEDHARALALPGAKLSTTDEAKR